MRCFFRGDLGFGFRECWVFRGGGLWMRGVVVVFCSSDKFFEFYRLFGEEIILRDRGILYVD